MLRDRDMEIQDIKFAVQTHEADEEKVCQLSLARHFVQTKADDSQLSGEISVLEAEIKRVQIELTTARRAEGYLETQKQENLQLKETIDRMKFDLDEARAAATKGIGHVRGPTGSSGPATLSRNLGDELHRRLLDAEPREETEGVDEDDAEDYVETVVTTQRTRVSFETLTKGMVS